MSFTETDSILDNLSDTFSKDSEIFTNCFLGSSGSSLVKHIQRITLPKLKSTLAVSPLSSVPPVRFPKLRPPRMVPISPSSFLLFPWLPFLAQLLSFVLQPLWFPKKHSTC